MLNRSRDRRQTKRDPAGSELLHAPLECATLVMPSANISFTAWEEPTAIKTEQACC